MHDLLKKYLIISLAAVPIAASLLATEPIITVGNGTLKRNGSELTKKTWSVRLPEGSVVLQNTVDPNGTLIKSQFGDFRFGLVFGSELDASGSWCPWEFLRAEGVDKRALTSSTPAKDVVFSKFNDGAYVDFIWNTGSVKVLQYSSAAKWVFVKVTIPAGIKTVTLKVWPGGTHYNINGRERRIRLGSTDMNLPDWNMRNIPFAPENAGVAFYNRNYREQYGNFLVFEPENVEKVSACSCNYVEIRFTAKPEVRELKFALGYFIKESAEDAMSRFLVEHLPNIKKMLDDVNWEPKMDFSAFEFSYGQVKELISGLNEAEQKIFSEQLGKIRSAFDQTKKDGNATGCSAALDDLRKLQQEVGQAGIASLKK